MNLGTIFLTAGVLVVLTTQTLNLGNKTVGTSASCPPNFSPACSAQPQFTNLQTLQCCIRTTCSILSSKNHPTHTKPSSTLLNLLILLSGDVSPNPGPRAPKYPCGVCCKAVNWGQDAVKCDEGDAWYHVPCMNMNPSFYHILQDHSNITWLCCQCGMPSFSSSLFNTTPIDLSNSFSVLSISSRPPSSTCISSPPRPIHASTPNATPNTTHRTPNRATLFSDTTQLDLSNLSPPANSNTTKDLHTSPHPAYIITPN